MYRIATSTMKTISFTHYHNMPFRSTAIKQQGSQNLNAPKYNMDDWDPIWFSVDNFYKRHSLWSSEQGH